MNDIIPAVCETERGNAPACVNISVVAGNTATVRGDTVITGEVSSARVFRNTFFVTFPDRLFKGFSNFTMSQPALTSFFGQTKRATRSRGSKVLDAPSADPPPTKRSTRTNKTKKEVEISAEPSTPVIVKPTETVKVDEEANVLQEIKHNATNKQKEAENKEPETREEEAIKPKRGRKKVLKETSEPNDDCPSPAKRGRRTKKVTEVEAAQEVAKKLTPAEVKEKLKGSKLNDLKDRLKKIEESKESVKVKKAKAEVAAKKVEEDKAKKDAKLEYEKTPAYIRFHNLALKGDGTLPLPYSYKFLEEVFR